MKTHFNQTSINLKASTIYKEDDHGGFFMLNLLDGTEGKGLK